MGQKAAKILKPKKARRAGLDTLAGETGERVLVSAAGAGIDCHGTRSSFLRTARIRDGQGVNEGHKSPDDFWLEVIWCYFLPYVDSLSRARRAKLRSLKESQLLDF